MYDKNPPENGGFVSGLTPSYEGALDMPIILCYIMIKDCKPKTGFQPTKIN